MGSMHDVQLTLNCTNINNIILNVSTMYNALCKKSQDSTSREGICSKLKKKIDGGVHEFILNKKYMLSYHMHDYDE